MNTRSVRQSGRTPGGAAGRRRRGLALAALALLAPGARAGEDDWFVPLGRPPKASPRRISGGESFPPLPLPATPLRRSERKREPAPPQLVAKIVWGESGLFQYEGGGTARVTDWNQCPSDLQQLLRRAAGTVGVSYGSAAVPLAGFHGDPARTPVLFFSGSRSVRLDGEQLAQLRGYVLRGGMVVCDNIAGSPYFYASMREMVAGAFPESALRVVPPDHPLYHMVVDVGRVRYPRNLDATEPFLEAVYVGCRIGVLVSRYGLGCGWDGREVPFLDKAVFYDVASARRIGLNLVAYAVGYAEAAREEAKPELFGALDERAPTDEFVFAQLRHGGAWNVHPGGAAALLRRLRQHTSLRVSLRRVEVDPARDDLAGYPFLYLAGLDEFAFDDTAVARLRHFLNGAGTLLVNNGLGLSTFDRAARRELKRILPEAELQPVPPEHPLYRAVFDTRTVRYTPAAAGADGLEGPPRLEGVTINGALRVIYSPLDIEAGWQGSDHPLARGYDPHSAMALGVNIILYSATH